MSGIWYVLIGIAIVANWLFAQFVFKPWLARNKYKKPEAPPEDGELRVRETCDIHGKVGEPIRYDCGHDDAPEFRIDLWGVPTFHKKPEYGTLLCSSCLLTEARKGAARCGRCGFIISPGDPVALCVDDKRVGKKEWKTYVGKDLLVCLRWDCENGPGYCGHWMGDHIKPAFPDGGSHISQVFKTGEPLFTQIGPIDPTEPPTE